MRVLWALASLLVVFLLVSVITNSVVLWRVWSLLGDQEFYMAVSLALYYLHPSPSTALLVLLSVVFSGSLNVYFKYWLRLPRPPDPLVHVEGPGFPSGHAQVSTSFWTTLSSAAREQALYLVSAVVLSGVSLSRVYLRAHYPLDVVGGVLLGLFCGLAVFASTRLLGYMGSALCAVASTAVSLLALLVLGAPSDTCSVLVATSLALLLLYAVSWRRGFKPPVISAPLRVSLLALSMVVILAAHTTTRGADFAARTLAMLFSTLFALGSPLVIGFLRFRAR